MLLLFFVIGVAHVFTSVIYLRLTSIVKFEINQENLGIASDSGCVTQLRSGSFKYPIWSFVLALSGTSGLFFEGSWQLK